MVVEITVKTILHDQTNMTKVCAKIVPKNNNVLAHSVLFVKLFLAKNRTPVL